LSEDLLPAIRSRSQIAYQLKRASAFVRIVFGSAQSIADAQHGFLETGKRWPRLDTLMGVAEGLNISVDELLKGLHKPSRKRVSP